MNTFGFTDAEVRKQLLASITAWKATSSDERKEWYDGYRFGDARTYIVRGM